MRLIALGVLLVAPLSSCGYIKTLPPIEYRICGVNAEEWQLVTEVPPHARQILFEAYPQLSDKSSEVAQNLMWFRNAEQSFWICSARRTSRPIGRCGSLHWYLDSGEDGLEPRNPLEKVNVCG